MNGATVFLIAFFTSVATATGTAYVLQKLDVFGAPAQEMSVVPDLVGLSQQDAQVNLNGVGLVLMIGGREPSAEAADGAILRQSLPPGQQVPRGQSVSVTLATAIPKVPDVVGQALAQATATLVEAGYKVKEGEPQAHPTLETGQVVEQSPVAGKPLAAQEVVVLKVSSGPGEVEVPKVTGYNLASAKKQLEEAGLEASVRWVSLAETVSNVVLRQTPAAGKQAQTGSKVELVINRD